MDNLYFPQLASGALAQYPIARQRIFRTITNALPDGRLILLPDPAASKLIWTLQYHALSQDDLQALEAFYGICNGPLKGFTFLDPTSNLLSHSADLASSMWQSSGLLSISAGATDPDGGTLAFDVTNKGQAAEDLNQSVSVPAGYQYCFTTYAKCTVSSTLNLFLRGANTAGNVILPIGPTWTRLTLSTRLTDQSSTLTAGVTLAAGQEVQLFGPQLEGQLAPSTYSATYKNGGVYAFAHWAMQDFVFTANGPDRFATTAVIETSIPE